jgi:hypothetical protein
MPTHPLQWVRFEYVARLNGLEPHLRVYVFSGMGGKALC